MRQVGFTLLMESFCGGFVAVCGGVCGGFVVGFVAGFVVGVVVGFFSRDPFVSNIHVTVCPTTHV